MFTICQWCWCGVAPPLLLGSEGVQQRSQQNEIEIVILDMGESKSLSKYGVGSLYSVHNESVGWLEWTEKKG